MQDSYEASRNITFKQYLSNNNTVDDSIEGVTGIKDSRAKDSSIKQGEIVTNLPNNNTILTT